MYPRANYKDDPANNWAHVKDPVASVKHDGAHFFVPVSSDGSLSFISRRQSVHGHYPDRTSQLPQFKDIKLPQHAGSTLNVELVHTGQYKTGQESHSTLSGILNSLPPRAIETQRLIGPVRAILLDVSNPEFRTYKDKLLHLKKITDEAGASDIFQVVTPVIGHSNIRDLIQSTKMLNKEGVIVTSLTEPEDRNPRLKIKHKLMYNLRVVGIVQEIDKDGNPKDSMGALIVADSSGKIVANVGTGFSRFQRKDAWENKPSWMGRLIQVETMGLARDKLRAPVYNGDADGDWDLVS